MPVLSKLPETACGPTTLRVQLYLLGLMKVVTLETTVPVVFVGLVACSVKVNTSRLVMPPPEFVHVRVVLPFCVIVGNVAIAISLGDFLGTTAEEIYIDFHLSLFIRGISPFHV